MSEPLPEGGIELSPAEIDALDARWSSCWTPSDIAHDLTGITTPWYIAAGWALDLFRGKQTREHGDIEIAIPAASFPEVRDRFQGHIFDAVDIGRFWENATPDVLAATHQTWLRDPVTGNYCSTCSASHTTATRGSADAMRRSGFPTATSSATPRTASPTWHPSSSCCSRQNTPARKTKPTSTKPSRI